jgi:hypothetical protein
MQCFHAAAPTDSSNVAVLCCAVLWCGVPQMAALQVHAEYGPGLDSEDPEGFSAALERFITRQVLMTRPKDEWRADVAARYAWLLWSAVLKCQLSRLGCCAGVFGWG